MEPPRRPAVCIVVHGTGLARAAAVGRVRAGASVHDHVVGLAGPPDPATLADAARRAEVVVVLDAQARPGPRWLDPLVAALAADPALGAVSPTSNARPWPACGPDVPDADARTGVVADHARALRHAAADPAAVLDVDAGGPAVALRAAAVAAYARGGLDAVAAGWRSAVSPASYVHVRAGAPLLSAALIVRDEAERLDACLDALVGLVDEVVVHDTGSVDDTVARARAAGAVVVEGRWDDDFARAREVARRAARGRWVLSVDADEVLEATAEERAELRRWLAADPATPLATLPLFNLQGSVRAPVRARHPVALARLFRRTACSWHGALHEQLLGPAGTVPPTARLDAPRLVHAGYLLEVAAARAKGERNHRIARALAEAATDRAAARFEVGRALALGERWADALDELRAAADEPGDAGFRRAAAEYAVQAALRTGRPAEAAALVERLATLDGHPGVLALARARVALALHDPAGALAALDGVDATTELNDVFSANDPDEPALLRAAAHVALGRGDEARAELVALGAGRSMDPRLWALVAGAADEEPALLDAVVAEVAPDDVEALCRLVGGLGAPAAEAVLDALHRRLGHHAHVYAALPAALAGCDVEVAARWSARLRTIGLPERCPLVALATAPERHPLERFLAAAALVDAGDPAWHPHLQDQAEALPVGALAPLLAELLERGSAAADDVVLGAAVDVARCAALVTPLVEAGQLDQALTVVLHGATLAGGHRAAFLASVDGALGDAAAALHRRADVLGLTSALAGRAA